MPFLQNEFFLTKKYIAERKRWAMFFSANGLGPRGRDVFSENSL